MGWDQITGFKSWFFHLESQANHLATLSGGFLIFNTSRAFRVARCHMIPSPNFLEGEKIL